MRINKAVQSLMKQKVGISARPRPFIVEAQKSKAANLDTSKLRGRNSNSRPTVVCQPLRKEGEKIEERES